jgi:hypothetical protein
MNLDPSKSAARPSSQATKPSGTGDATDVDKTERQRMDRVAMDSATRGERRILNNEQRVPGDKEFTK